MKKTFLLAGAAILFAAGAAQAADIVDAPVSDWSGFYAGINAGMLACLPPGTIVIDAGSSAQLLPPGAVLAPAPAAAPMMVHYPPPHTATSLEG